MNELMQKSNVLTVFLFPNLRPFWSRIKTDVPKYEETVSLHLKSCIHVHVFIHAQVMQEQGFRPVKGENKRSEMPDVVINWHYTLRRERDWHEIIFKTGEDVSRLSPSSTSFVRLSPSCNSQPIRASWETLSVCQPPKAFQKSPRTHSTARCVHPFVISCSPT